MISPKFLWVQVVERKHDVQVLLVVVRYYCIDPLAGAHFSFVTYINRIVATLGILLEAITVGTVAIHVVS